MTGPATVAILDAGLDDRRVDIVVTGDRITSIVPAGRTPARADEVVDAAGGAVLPGLHDHHIHLLALAAAAQSVQAGPPQVADADALVQVLRAASARLAPGATLRAVGYHESVAGDIDRAWLDVAVADRPVRVQHRSGVMWVLNTAALAKLRPGAIDDEQRHSGRLVRTDAIVREPDGGGLDLRATFERLVQLGITGVTDLTPTTDVADWQLLADARATGPALDVVVTGAAALLDEPAPLPRGPVKVVLDDIDLPGLDDLADVIGGAHRSGRAVAVHTVTRTSVVLAVAAFDVAGPAPGDRLEHGAVIPIDLFDAIRSLGLTVVTQPAFVCERGDAYLRDVERSDVADLWRCRSLLDAGVAVGIGSDAPYGTEDPWSVIAAATSRTTPSGRLLGPGELIDARAGLDRYLADPARPGGPARRLTVGGPAAMVVLDRPLVDALVSPSADTVATVVLGDGHVIRR